MKLLTQEEGSRLEPGDVVNVYWFSPRKPKDGPEPPSREWDGRLEWLSEVWNGEVVASEPRQTANDGVAVVLQRGSNIYCVHRMELVERKIS